MIPVVNTHVHIPPNFSSFATPEAVIDAALEQEVRAIGVSNFFDQSVYGLFRSMAREAGIVPMFGLEFITVIPELESSGIRINDPSNPGRMYLTGKGIDPFAHPGPKAELIVASARRANDVRSHKMIAAVAERFGAVGFDTGVTPKGLAALVAARAGVPLEWVSLQERHIAMAFQEALFGLDEVSRMDVLRRAFDGPALVAPWDASGMQSEIRNRLLKAGAPCFVPEVALSFGEAYAYILAMGGIPCYPILADGSHPVCPFEESPTVLAATLHDMGIHAAELIPNRNMSAVVDVYVEALTSQGIMVMGGTEHNTPDMMPLLPQCVDGPMSDYARECFYEATCIVACHASRREWMQSGYVDDRGQRVGDLSYVQAMISEGHNIINPL